MPYVEYINEKPNYDHEIVRRELRDSSCPGPPGPGDDRETTWHLYYPLNSHNNNNATIDHGMG